MDIQVGVNSYMTLEEANTIVASSYKSASKERTYWNSLSDDDKSILLVNATDKVDRPDFIYRGKTAYGDQEMQWPRNIAGKVVEAPFSIKKGLILQMLYDELESTTDEYKLKEMGVKSFADGGGARIEFADTSASVSNSIKNKVGVNKNIWNSYFKEWSMIV